MTTANKKFICGHQDSSGLDTELIETLGLSFPQSHYDSNCLSAYALARQQKNLDTFAILPFCCTIEAEALGGRINLGDERIGPRPGEFLYSSLEMLMENFPSFDFKEGRIGALLSACQQLSQSGTKLAVEISGPLSILSGLLPLTQIIKSWRKNETLMNQAFEQIGTEQLRFAEELKNAGVDLISFADPVGVPHIIGPKFSELLANSFLVSFLSQLQKFLGGKSFHVCPNTARLLINSNKAKWEVVNLSKPLSYQEACLDLSNEGMILGQGCIKRKNFILKNCVIKQLRLLELD